MKVNLLPPSPPVVRLSVVIGAVVIAGFCAVAALLGVSVYANWTRLSADRAALPAQEAMLSREAVAAQAMRAVIQRQALLLQEQNWLRKWPNAATALDRFVQDLPTGGKAVTLSFASGQISADVEVPSEAQAAAFILTLQADRLFANATVTSVTNGTGSKGASAGVAVQLTVAVP